MPRVVVGDAVGAGVGDCGGGVGVDGGCVGGGDFDGAVVGEGGVDGADVGVGDEPDGGGPPGFDTGGVLLPPPPPPHAEVKANAGVMTASARILDSATFRTKTALSMRFAVYAERARRRTDVRTRHSRAFGRSASQDDVLVRDEFYPIAEGIADVAVRFAVERPIVGNEVNSVLAQPCQQCVVIGAAECRMRFLRWVEVGVNA